MSVYTHRQIGWVIIGCVAVPAVIALLFLTRVAPFAAAIVVTALLPALFVFGSLTTVATDDSLELRFGVGALRRRFDFDAIDSVKRVTNPWYYGWGIHYLRGCVIYNVSGFDAVELSLMDGRKVRVGTDDAERLAEILNARIAQRRRTGDATRTSDAIARGAVAASPLPILAFVVLPILCVVGIAMFMATRPLAVTVTDQALVVRGGGYSDTVQRNEIDSLSLEPVLPAVTFKTNGFSLGSTLRGNFRLRDLGNAHLFVDRDSPFFVRVRTPHDLLFISYEDPQRTRDLYAQLTAGR
jgi:hypothetical protein